MPRPGRYPADLIDVLDLPAARLVIRPVLPRDAPLLQDFVTGLSPAARRSRFWHPLNELPRATLSAFTEIDYFRHLGLVATVFERGVERIVGEARYVADSGPDRAEVAIAVADAWQRNGIGRRLLDTLAAAARVRGTASLFCLVQDDNEAMQALAISSGYARVEVADEPGTCRFEQDLPDHGQD